MERKKSILVIDDSADMLKLDKLVLESDGYKVFTALSGTAALHFFEGTERPDLVLLDLALGDMNGQQFLKILEEKHPEILKTIPFVFLSGTIVDQATQGKAVGHIRKGLGIDQFLKAVHQFI